MTATPLSVLDHYIENHFINSKTEQQYRIAVRSFVRAGCSFSRADLMRYLKGHSGSPRTANNHRSVVLMLWQWGFDEGLLPEPPPRVPRKPEFKWAPTAWNVEELSRLISAASQAPPIKTWTSAEWVALILVAYDTALRIGAILSLRWEDISGNVLTCRAETQKQRCDTVHELSSQTMLALQALGGTTGPIFRWPVRRRQLWPRFREIVKAAGLPATRRDLFHRIRRTSYSHVARSLGIEAATRHAGHHSDLSRVYFDPRFGQTSAAVRALPRP